MNVIEELNVRMQDAVNAVVMDDGGASARFSLADAPLADVKATLGMSLLKFTTGEVRMIPAKGFLKTDAATGITSLRMAPAKHRFELLERRLRVC